jgi:pyruvate-ferredoxin/flavodoxin oxidoreductase
VLAAGRNVNVLVMDTEVYSNTGGQASKATPIGSIAKFAAAGKRIGKKDLGLISMTYGYIYVASVNMGANKPQVLKALLEAEAYDGPSIVIAYSTCINHGIDMRHTMAHQKAAADAGHWPIYRFDPRLKLEGKNPMVWESKEPSIPFKDYILNERRYSQLKSIAPTEVDQVFLDAENDAKKRFAMLKHLAE